jgi:2,5-dihydroxypyridine 5,6-dioxygenase
MLDQHWTESVDTSDKVGRIARMFATASAFVSTTLRLTGGEQVAVITDTEVSPLVYYCVAGAIRAAGGVAAIVVMDPLDVPGAEPSRPVAAAMRDCDILINCASRSITTTMAAKAAYIDKKIRYVVMANPTEQMLLEGAATADYTIVRSISLATRDALNSGTEVHITSPSGTDVVFDTADRSFCAYYAMFEEGNTITAFPAGEVNTTPNEHSGRGRIVFDLFMMEIGDLLEPICWDLDGGRIVSISGGKEAKAFERLIDDKGDEFSRFIGELSLGTNYLARASRSALELKQVYGNLHIACGTGITATDGSWQGQYQSRLHLDGVLSRPTIEVDSKVVVLDGEILVAPRPSGSRA